MNDQQKKEILEAKGFSEFCSKNRDKCKSGCVFCEIPTMGVCADEFYRIKIQEIHSVNKLVMENLLQNHQNKASVYSPTRLEYFAAASIAGDANITPQGALSFARAVIEELDK